MRSILSVIIFVFLFYLTPQSGFSFEIPPLKTHVNDYAGVLSPETVTKIQASASLLEKQDSTQVVVLTIKDMGGAADIKEFANKVFVAWGLGQKNADNGVLIVLAIKERMVRIEVGKGLEEHLTDAECAQLIRASTAALKKGDYSEGIQHIFGGVSNVVTGKFAPRTGQMIGDQTNQPHVSAPWVEKTAAIVNSHSFPFWE